MNSAFEAVRRQLEDAKREVERQLAAERAAYWALSPREQREADFRALQFLVTGK